MTPLQPRPERQKSFGDKSIGCLDVNLVDYVAILICHSYPNKDPYSALLDLFRTETVGHTPSIVDFRLAIAITTARSAAVTIASG